MARIQETVITDLLEKNDRLETKLNDLTKSARDEENRRQMEELLAPLGSDEETVTDAGDNQNTFQDETTTSQMRSRDYAHCKQQR